MSCGGGHLRFPIGIKNKNFNYMNVHWMVLYNLKVFCSAMKFKMAATAGLSLTLDPMGKMFQNASSQDIPMIIPLQFGFSQFISFREEDL
jgi:hypothetical protein